MKSMLQLPVAAAFALAPVLCTPALSATPETPATTVAADGDYPFAAVRDAASIKLRYWGGTRGIREVNVTGAQMKRLADILSLLQPYRNFDDGATVHYRCAVLIDIVVEGKTYSIAASEVSTEAGADKYATRYILGEADYAELMDILHALDPHSLSKDGDRYCPGN